MYPVSDLRFVALDLETTGFDVWGSRIVEAYLREVTLADPTKMGKEWSYVLDPQVLIPESMTALHGFCDADVVGKPCFEDVAAELQDALRGACIIGHNVRKFDVPLLNRMLRAAGQSGLSPRQPVIDTLEWFRKDQRHTLTDAARFYLNESHPDAHSARGDVDMTLRVLAAQLPRRSPEEMELAIKQTHHLDFEGRFWMNHCGVVHFGFGKWRNEPVELHRSYLKWMLGAGFGHEVKGIVRNLLDGNLVPWTDGTDQAVSA